MQCYKCGRKLGGFLQEQGTQLEIDGEQHEYCLDCLFNAKNDLSQKKNCDICAHFEAGFCRKIQTSLTSISIGLDDFYIQADKCIHFISQKDYERKATSAKVAKEENVKEKEIIREKEVIVKLRCSYCHHLYEETLNVCPHCGGRA